MTLKITGSDGNLRWNLLISGCNWTTGSKSLKRSSDQIIKSQSSAPPSMRRRNSSDSLRSYRKDSQGPRVSEVSLWITYVSIWLWLKIRVPMTHRFQIMFSRKTIHFGVSIILSHSHNMIITYSSNCIL